MASTMPVVAVLLLVLGLADAALAKRDGIPSRREGGGSRLVPVMSQEIASL